jgi:hypothetical protein
MIFPISSRSFKSEVLNRFSFAIILTTLVTLLAYFIGMPDFPVADGTSYVNMATSTPLKSVRLGFRSRFLIPYIISIFPNVGVVFFLLNFVSVIALGLLSFRVLTMMRFETSLQYIGVALILLSPALLWTSIYFHYYLDGISWVIYLSAVIAAIDDRPTILTGIIAIGLFVKPLVLTAGVFYAVIHFEWPPTRRYIYTGILGVSTIILVRYIIQIVVPGAGTYYDLELIRQNFQLFFTSGYIKWITTGYTFGVGFVYAAWSIINYKKISINWLRRSLLVIPVVAFQLLLATGWQRVLFQLFPVIIPLSLLPLSNNEIGLPKWLRVLPYLVFTLGLLVSVTGVYLYLFRGLVVYHNSYLYITLLAALHSIPFIYSIQFKY